MIGALASPFISAFLTLQLAKRQESERVSLSIIWTWVQDRSGSIEEAPGLVVHNRGSIPIYVTDICFRRTFSRRRLEGTAKYYEDPTDLHFPYEVLAGKTTNLILDHTSLTGQIGSVGFVRTLFWRLGIAPFAVEINTTAGTRVSIDATQALEYLQRPEWLRE